jgi:hypothetical protein
MHCSQKNKENIMKVLLRNLRVSILFLGCLLVVYGCSEERLQSTAVDLLTGTDTSVIAPPPPEIASLLWGDLEVVKAKLADVLDDGSYTEDGRIILDGAGVARDGFLYEIDFIETQRTYYQKYVDVAGIAIIGSRDVDDIFFHAARKVVLGMTAKRREVRDWLSVHRGDWPADRFRMILASPLCDYPQVHVSVEDRGRVCDRFKGACVGESYCVVVAQYSSFYEGELSFSRTFIHEMGHAMHYALRDTDPTFQERLEIAYVDANTGEGGSLFGGMPNDREFWAEATRYWFGKVASPDPLAKWGENLLQSDPLLYELLDEVYPLLYLREVDWEHLE